MKELESLRARKWDGIEHRRKLEETLMKTHGVRTFVITRSRALLVALALALFGAIATAAVYEWKGMTIISTRLDDGSTRIEVTRDGEKIIDEIVRPDEDAMVTDDGDIVIVEPASEEPGSDPK